MTHPLQPEQSPDPLNEHDPQFMRTFDDHYALTWADGAIPAKYKELTGIALSISGRCEPCLRYHVTMAVQAGATRAEVTEIVRLCLVASGSITIPTARLAYTLLDDILLTP